MRNEIYDKIVKIQQAIKLNKLYTKHHDKPHQRDLARMRIKILKRKEKYLWEKYNETKYI